MDPRETRDSELNLFKMEAEPMTVTQEQEIRGLDIQVELVGLGSTNAGSIGNSETTVETRAAITADVSNPEYIVPVDRWRSCCVDGGLDEQLNPNGEYPSQLAGSIVTSESAAELMVGSQSKPLSQITAEKTKLAVSDGIEVVVHGDTNKGKLGCAANAYLKDVLQYNQEHAEEVAGLVEALAGLSGLDMTKYGLGQEDVLRIIDQGAKAATNSQIIDVDPPQNTDIAVENGAQYVELDRVHSEQAVVVSTSTDYTFNGTNYSKQHDDGDGNPPQYFVVSLASYVESAFKRGQNHGVDAKDTARLVLGVMAFNVGVAKYIGNQNLEAAVLSVK